MDNCGKTTAKRWMGIALGVVLLAQLLWALPIESQAAGSGTCDANAQPANLNFTLKDMNGKDVSLSSYKGRVILLNFWATWCGPCKIEIPGFVDLYNKYQSRGLVVLGLSTDDPPSKLKPFAEALKMDYPVLVGNGREDVQRAYPLFGLPNTFIIGRDGKVCTKHEGFATKEQLEQYVKALL